mmetsp:Transcript_19293/g.40525  ORF Transcript_19293/g.40525 Transcript_19293/m.40525 type:complete len:214 (-) Transcript_19293:380-1021(-)
MFSFSALRSSISAFSFVITSSFSMSARFLRRNFSFAFVCDAFNSEISLEEETFSVVFCPEISLKMLASCALFCSLMIFFSFSINSCFERMIFSFDFAFTSRDSDFASANFAFSSWMIDSFSMVCSRLFNSARRILSLALARSNRLSKLSFSVGDDEISFAAASDVNVSVSCWLRRVTSSCFSLTRRFERSSCCVANCTFDSSVVILSLYFFAI